MSSQDDTAAPPADNPERCFNLTKGRRCPRPATHKHEGVPVCGVCSTTLGHALAVETNELRYLAARTSWPRWA